MTQARASVGGRPAIAPNKRSQRHQVPAPARIEAARDTGKPTWHKPLVGGKVTALIDLEIGARLKRRGILDRNWYWNANGEGQGYVKCKAGSGFDNIYLARVIVEMDGGDKDKSVRYNNSNRADLRLDNLRTEQGRRRRNRSHLSKARILSAKLDGK